MSNRSRRDDRDEDIPPCRETPEGRAVHSSPGDAGVMDRLEDTLARSEAGEHIPHEELASLAHDSAESLASMRFVPAEDIDEALDELFGGEYDHRHDGNAICPSCGGVFVKHYRFLLPCRSDDIGKDDFVPVCTPEDYFAFREDDGTLVVESPGGEQWEYCSFEEARNQDLSPDCSRGAAGAPDSHGSLSANHVVWNCKPLGKKDPVTEDYMRSISS